MLLRTARADRSIADVAATAGISAETLRKIETGRIPTPAFFTVAALADALDLSLDALVATVASVPALTPAPRSASSHPSTSHPRSLGARAARAGT